MAATLAIDLACVLCRAVLCVRVCVQPHYTGGYSHPRVRLQRQFNVPELLITTPLPNEMHRYLTAR